MSRAIEATMIVVAMLALGGMSFAVGFLCGLSPRARAIAKRRGWL